METFTKSQVVSGVSFFDGNIDGKEIKSASVFIESAMDKGNAKGRRTVEFKCLDADVVKRVFDKDFPAQCEVEYGLQVSKGAHSMVVTKLTVGAPALRKAA